MANLKELKINGIDIIDIIYPIGSIYLTINTQDPSEVIGGEWELWGKGKTIVGVDNSQTEFNSVEKTGGEKTHKLTQSEMPKHYHGFYQYNLEGKETRWAAKSSEQIPVDLSWSLINETGSSVPHNNLQPYITCYMWKRIS